MGVIVNPQASAHAKSITDAVSLMNAGRLDEATEKLRRVLALTPDEPNALGVIGVIEARQGHLESALAHLKRAVLLRPSFGPSHFNLAVALQKAGDMVGAEKHYLEAIKLQPRMASYHNNLGTLYSKKNDDMRACQSFEAALASDPSHEIAVANLYATYRRLGDMAALESLTARAVKQWPDNANHWIHRAECLFFLGRLSEAWPLYEWRFKAPNRPVNSRKIEKIPVWQGEDLSAKSVLIWTEQGPGDEVMYGSMFADIQSRVGRLTVLCSVRLVPLFQRSFPEIRFISEPSGEIAKAIDVQASIVAFAASLRQDLSAFPLRPSFLCADQAKADVLRAAYRGQSDDLLVGIAWRSTGVDDAEQKSIGLEDWGALFALPKIRFVNLQYGDCRAELAAIQSEYGMSVRHDETIDPLLDIDGFAAQVAAMDLVVCSSNTAAHIAGALGVETICMIPATAGFGRRWYWLLKEEHCAWYPSMTLHAQSKPGVWLDAVCRAAITLTQRLLRLGRKEHVAAFLISAAAAYRKAKNEVCVQLVLGALGDIAGYKARAFFLAGTYAKEDGLVEIAIQAFNSSIECDPNYSPALNMLGVLYAAKGLHAQAEPLYRRAIAAAPEAVEAYNNLGTTLRHLGRSVEADALYRRAAELMPEHSGILLNLATNLTEIGQPHAAIEYFDRLLKLRPDYAEAHHSRSFALVTSGRFSEGWPEMWWRHQALAESVQPIFYKAEAHLPRWQGQDLKGKSIIVWTEHGLGDQILAASLMAEVARQAHKVTLVCSRRLFRLFERSFPDVRIVGVENESDPEIHQLVNFKEFDFQASFSELGQFYRSSIESFPSRNSFLIADSKRSEKLHKRYSEEGAFLSVGLSWASANYELGGLKTLRLRPIVEALISVPGLSSCAHFVNLQYGDHATEIAETQSKTNSVIFQDPEIDALGDVDAFAAQVAAMDAVVTISNTTAHFAGALGIPTFLLLPYNRGRHWYWLRSFRHCPWYPSVRYFVQSDDGAWDHALKNCSQDLHELLQVRALVANANLHVT